MRRQKKLIVTQFTMGLLLVLGCIILSFAFAGRTNLMNKWVLHTYDVLHELECVATQISVLESSNRGYLISGDEKFYDDYKENLEHLTGCMASVENMVKDNPQQIENLAKLTRILAEKQAIMDSNMAKRRELGRSLPPDVFINKGGFEVRQQIFEVTRGMIKLEKELLDGRLSEAKRSFIGLVVGFAASVVLAFILKLILYLHLLDQVKKRELAEQIMTEKAAQLELFIRAAPASISVYDKRMHFLSVSDEWCRRMNKKREDVLGKLSYTAFPEQPTRWRDDHKEVLTNGTRIESRDEEVEFSGGRLEYLNRILVPWFANGEIAGLIAFSTFITDEISARRELRRLRRMIQEIEDEKARVLTDLERKRLSVKI